MVPPGALLCFFDEWLLSFELDILIRLSAGLRTILSYRCVLVALNGSKRFCAKDRSFLSEAGRFPFRETFDDSIQILHLPLGSVRAFPFGNEGQFAFVNPFRRNEVTFSTMSKTCA